MVGDWPGNRPGNMSGWYPKDRSKSAKRKRRWPWFVALLVLLAVAALLLL